jgi:hypothetical protein
VDAGSRLTFSWTFSRKLPRPASSPKSGALAHGSHRGPSNELEAGDQVGEAATLPAPGHWSRLTIFLRRDHGRFCKNSVINTQTYWTKSVNIDIFPTNEPPEVWNQSASPVPNCRRVGEGGRSQAIPQRFTRCPDWMRAVQRHFYLLKHDTCRLAR